MTHVEKVLAPGAFSQVGAPTAVDDSASLVVVGGDLGWPQWHGRSVLGRASRRLGWSPIGVYDRGDTSCLRFLTSRWPINSIAIHPGEKIVAIGTGAYDGGYAFEGALLILDLERGGTRSVLQHPRMIEHVTWVDTETLEITMAPVTDEEVDWPDIPYEAGLVTSSDWSALEDRDIDLAQIQTRPVPAPPSHERANLERQLRKLAVPGGQLPLFRRQCWALTAYANGLLVGVEGGLEGWTVTGDDLRWRRSLPGYIPVQAMPMADDRVLVVAWKVRDGAYNDRDTLAFVIDRLSGTITADTAPGEPRVATTSTPGLALLRDTRIGSQAPQRPAVIVDVHGRRLGELDLGRYDLFNHYFAIKGAAELYVLVGEGPNSHKNKEVAVVRAVDRESWEVRRLYPLAWAAEAGRHLTGGPGAWLTDALGEGIVHAGLIHDPVGVISGNVFVARRRHPDGELLWQVRLDNAVTDVELIGSVVVVATNVGDLLQIDALHGQVLSSDVLELDGWPVVPLSLSAAADGNVWVGTLDGRVALVRLN